jgi:hypothetical protein
MDEKKLKNLYLKYKSKYLSKKFEITTDAKKILIDKAVNGDIYLTLDFDGEENSILDKIMEMFSTVLKEIKKEIISILEGKSMKGGSSSLMDQITVMVNEKKEKLYTEVDKLVKDNTNLKEAVDKKKEEFEKKIEDFIQQKTELKEKKSKKRMKSKVTTEDQSKLDTKTSGLIDPDEAKRLAKLEDDERRKRLGTLTQEEEERQQQERAAAMAERHAGGEPQYIKLSEIYEKAGVSLVDIGDKINITYRDEADEEKNMDKLITDLKLINPDPVYNYTDFANEYVRKNRRDFNDLNFLKWDRGDNTIKTLQNYPIPKQFVVNSLIQSYVDNPDSVVNASFRSLTIYNKN